VLTVEAGVGGRRVRLREKDAKTRQKRRIALDEDTLAVLAEHVAGQDRDADSLGLEIDAGAYLFSLAPDCAAPLVADSVS
jgi:integrase